MNKREFAGVTILALIASLITVLGAAAPASAAVTLPATTSWTNAGLQQMALLTGRLKTSIDGVGSTTGSGSVQVEKPSANAKVVAAFVTLVGTTGTGSLATPTDVQLDGQTISFSHWASVTQNTAFRNFFADVTTLVKPTVDAAGAGILDITVNEGATQTRYDGLSLIVVFDDPNTVWSSVLIAFGASKSAGDSFSLAFPALNANELSGHRLSVGIGFGFQGNNNGSQASTIDITTSSQASPTRIAEYAGSFDDGAAANGALITVGGVGDSNANPIIGAPFVHPADDELYNLSGLLNVGDTELTISTRNASGDDNLFQAVFFINRVSITGATVVWDPSLGGQPTQDRNAPNTDVDLPPGSTSSPAPQQSTQSSNSTPSVSPASTASSTYDGPEILEFSSRSLYPGDTLILAGRKLDEIKTLVARGVTLSFRVIEGGRLLLTIPLDFPIGSADFDISSNYGKLQHIVAISVSQKPNGRELNVLSQTTKVNASFVRMVQRRLDRVREPYNKVLCIVNTPDQNLSEKVANEFCSQLVLGKRADAELVTEIRYNADFTRGFWVRVFLGWQKK